MNHLQERIERRRGERRRREDPHRARDVATASTTRWVAIGAAAAVGGYVLYRRLSPSDVRAPVDVARSITIERPVAEVYRFWREFENLPKVMHHLESVEPLGEDRSRWTAKGPAGTDVVWDAETVDDRPNERIAWRSQPDAVVPNSGSVRFRSLGEDRTQVDVAFTYFPPAGKVGAAIAKAFGREPAQQVGDGLRRMKQELETGSVVTSSYAHPSGRDQGSRDHGSRRDASGDDASRDGTAA